MIKQKAVVLKAILDYIPVLVYMTMIFYLSSISLEFPKWINILDQKKFSLHAAEYAILGYLLSRAGNGWRFPFMASSLYGLGDEVHQYFVPFRTADPMDFVADVIGSAIGVAMAYKFGPRNPYHGRGRAKEDGGKRSGQSGLDRERP